MRIYYINSLRLLATLAVVFLHTSAGLLDARNIEGFTDKFLLSCYKYTMQFSVPLFVMISGALFLNPTKKTGFDILLHKYVKRIVLALLIFGIPMCLIETYLTNQKSGLIYSLIQFITGHSWSHMWYLYMLIGLYLITPIIKPFVVNASNKDWYCTLGLLFIISSVLPTLNNIGIKITSYMTISSPYIFIYLLGYWLCWKAPQKLYSNTILLSTAILLCMGLIVTKCYIQFDYYGYADPIVICLAAAIFLLFRNHKVNWAFANKMTPYCFSIYLIHPIFINFAYKFLKIDTVYISLS